MVTTESYRAQDELLAGPRNTVAVRLALVPLLLASFTCTWSIVKPLGGQLAISDYLLALSLLVTVPIVLLGGRPISIPGWIFIPAVVIPVCLLVRQLDPPRDPWRVLRLQVQEQNPDNVHKALIWLAALYVVPLAITASAAIERRVVEWVIGAYVSGVAVSCVVAMTDSLRLTHIASNLTYHREIANPLDYRWGERQAGLADHPNMLGLICAISLPFVIYFMGRRGRTWISAIALIALFAGLLASGSRGAQAISPMIATVSVLCLPNKRAIARAIAVSATVLVAAGTVLLSTVLADDRRWFLRFTGGGDPYEAQRSDKMRLGLMDQAWTDFQKYPLFGAGIRHISEAHNIYLQLLAAGGVVLVAGMLAYFLCILRDCCRLSRYGILLARFLTISIAVWLVLGVVENQIVDRELYFTVGCVAALVATANASVPKDLNGHRRAHVRIAPQRPESGGVQRILTASARGHVAKAT
ncbi:O-antigen ligase family protein [Mycobacterium sp. OAE908]|uniref:O-antigen ligase family protein n=1 Tax=Mycobacterium sp. OAE908 TaxID=2817899 RepID=UPI001AE2C0A0